jgi:cell wall-associated NlpC family hydrolase
MSFIGPLQLVRPGPLDSVLLDGAYVSAELVEAVTAADLTRTIDGVTFFEITVHDPKHKLLRSALFQQRSVVKLEGNRFELVQVRKTGSDFQLTFEDVIVAELRRRKEPRTAAPGTTTRAAFVRRLVEEVNGTVLGPDSAQTLLDGFATAGEIAVPSVAPSVTDPNAPVGSGKGGQPNRNTIGSTDLNIVIGTPVTREPVGPIGDLLASIPVDARGHAGDTTEVVLDFLARTWALDFFGKHYATAEQIAQVAAHAGFTGDALVIAVAIALAESSGNPLVVSKPNSNGTVDRGLWQINSVHSQYDPKQLLVPSYNANAAFELSSGGTNFHPWTTFNNGDYKQHLAAAGQGVAAFLASRTAAKGDLPVVQDTSMIATAADRNTNEPKDWWTSIKTLADEVKWRVFCDLGVVWFAPDLWLIGQPPLVEINESSPGVDWLDFDFDVGKPRSTMTLQARATQWAIPPGVPIIVNDMGVGSGRWLVTNVKRSLFSSSVTVELTQPQSQLAEPAHQGPASPTDGVPTTDPVSGGAGASDRIKAMVKFATDQEGDEYRWAANGPDAWDCSGLVHAAAASVDAFVARNTTAALNQCRDAGTMISLQDGIDTFGALLWLVPPAGDHIAISLGDGRTIEALNPAQGVLISRSAGRFTDAGLVPDLRDGYRVAGGP